MSDDKPFEWGLRPRGRPDGQSDADPDAAEPDATEPVAPEDEPIDRGYFVALEPDAPPSHDLPTEAMATPLSHDLPTEAMAAQQPADWDVPTEAVAAAPAPLDTALEGASNALVAQPVGLDSPVDESAETSAIDSLFGEEAFQHYEAEDRGGTAAPAPPVGRQLAIPATIAAGPSTRPRAPLGRNQKILIGIAGGLVAALALTGLFIAGRALAPELTPAPVASASPTPTPTPEPEPVVEALGPVAPGVHAWDDLLGTECLDPFTSPWEEEFTVVDCAQPHAAQLVFRGRFDDPEATEYPGIEGLQSRMNLLCTSAEVIAYTAARGYSDIQFAAGFAADEADWAGGNREFFCFVSRSSGEPFIDSLALPDVTTPVLPVEPAPEP